ncbi:unnamed protein product [Lactuca saligna]|uniref:Secreted protein n=1 Tax=Lactuca saligna TaxID=75948 RepID=A0AA36E4R8_LACSI|nr:unnamed protein product [Lactuca saligna]
MNWNETRSLGLLVLGCMLESGSSERNGEDGDNLPEASQRRWRRRMATVVSERGCSNPKGRMSGSGVRWHTAEAPMLCPSVLSGEINERGAKKMADGGRGGIPTAATTLSDEVGVSDGWQSIVVDEFARFLLCFERIPARGRGCKRRTTMGWCWDDF